MTLSILVFLLLLAGGFPSEAIAQTVLPESRHTPLVIAHRGNHRKQPENTVASTKAAIQAGADYVEIDLRTTMDGHLVAMHDGSVDRTTNGKGLVKQLSWSEVQSLRVFNDNKRPHRVPDFEELLTVCKDKINIYLDFKEADVAETWRQIRAAGMEKQVVVYLNSIEQYDEWRLITPDVPLMTSLPDSIVNEDQFRDFLAHRSIVVFDNIRDPKLLAFAHQNGVQVWLDVQQAEESPDTWRPILSLGVDGMQTDHPAMLVRYLEGR
ncbi:glycerophosphoryl diester phosphodiesterase [Dyadobacter jejuensis]|uniref:Glycerophosphoryl diester phosphodiesterase n=1 Tax=Dyadobacter jejuensis TaxID=1082580 RepID=A0A316BBA4_9BACT|nr:glycerophosphodiester phosphodiesterase family protein [Dyadobacter jejuensis]PWJ59827.1 glycerophosphoryl diester phosphodiesterase [Dyadobacter jejuensis]